LVCRKGRDGAASFISAGFLERLLLKKRLPMNRPAAALA